MFSRPYRNTTKNPPNNDDDDDDDDDDDKNEEDDDGNIPHQNRSHASEQSYSK